MCRFGHAGEYNLHIRQGGCVAQSPRGGTRIGGGFFKDCFCFRSQFDECSAFQRLHDRNGNSKFCQHFVLFTGSAKFPVKIIQLDLHQIPGVGFGDPFQHLGFAMIGESDPVYLAFRLFPLHEIVKFPFFGDFPMCLVEPVHQVKIEISSFRSPELFVEDPFEIRILLQHHGRHLAGQVIGISRILCQSFASERFAFTVVVHVCGVEIIAACRHCPVQHRLSCLAVDFPVFFRQTHQPESKQGKRPAGIFIASSGDLRQTV